MEPPRKEAATASPSSAVSTMKRAYKLQEFVAHASNVNCLKIGKKTSRVLVTGGEDHKVNMWAIGRPNAIMSLSGHSSAVECVTFDTAEALVAAGAASGTIKLWDLEEAKIVRTLTGHRSNCISVDFHPFGEFFASGSLDTNLKIWDIRRKGCIHTYKGHTRGVNAIKFSPDGRWVVSGGEDNIVKLWDLTAGKLMHDFKCHEGQILCLDFHPHEFLLATGSADRTVKFWDLETFELIGSAGPETSGVRSMVFNPDGRTLLTGLHENMKVFSWEPLRCHDIVDVGWSKLGDLNIHEGKLLGCSYNQSCVGIWVVDLLCVGPYAPGRMNGTSIINQPSQQMVDGSLKSSNVIRNVSPQSMKDLKISPTLSAENVASRAASTSSVKVSTVGSITASTYMLAPKRTAAIKGQASPVIQPIIKSDVAPVVVPRNAPGAEPVIVRPVEMGSTRPLLPLISTQASDSGRGSNSKNNIDGDQIAEFGSLSRRTPAHRGRMHPGTNQLCSETSNEGGQMVGENEPGKWIGPGKFRRADSFGAQQDDDGTRNEHRFSSPRSATLMVAIEAGRRSMASGYDKKDTVDIIYVPAGHGKGTQGVMDVMDGSSIMIGNDGDIVEQLMQPHSSFLNTLQSRFMKLQIIRRFWAKNDLKGAVEAMAKMADQSVLVDVLSCLIDRSEVFTLEACTLLLPLLNGLLSSNLDRYLSTALAVLSLLVKNFGQVIHSTRTASPSFGVDIHLEERIERCNACYLELQNTMQSLTPLLRRTGEIGRSAQDLSITLQEV